MKKCRAFRLGAELRHWPYASLGYQSVPRPCGVIFSTVHSGIGLGAPRGSCPGSAVSKPISSPQVQPHAQCVCASQSPRPAVRGGLRGSHRCRSESGGRAVPAPVHRVNFSGISPSIRKVVLPQWQLPVMVMGGLGLIFPQIFAAGRCVVCAPGNTAT